MTGAAGAPVLAVRSVSCELGGRPVLHDVDLSILPGTMTVVVGPNGAGKSTLLGALSGDVVPTAGAVQLDGTDLRSWSTADLARRRAVLAQGNDVSFGFSVREVVTMGRHPWWRQAEAAEDERIVGESLVLADVEHLADRPFRELSGGEKARVSLARVLAQDTEVVLLDEPTAALDLQHQESVMSLAGRLARRGRTVVVVAHDLSLASAHADVLVVVDRGRVAAAGTPAEVVTPERIAAVYGVEVSVHELEGRRVVVPRAPVADHDLTTRHIRPDNLS